MVYMVQTQIGKSPIPPKLQTYLNFIATPTHRGQASYFYLRKNACYHLEMATPPAELKTYQNPIEQVFPLPPMIPGLVKTD